MEKSCTSCNVSVNTEFGSKNSAELCNFDRVIENVLSVACTVFETAEELDELVIETVYVSLDDCSLTFLLDAVLYLTASLIDHFLNACRVDTSVSDKLFERNPCDLTADLIKT